MGRGARLSVVAGAIVGVLAMVTPAAARARHADGDGSQGGFVTVMLGRSIWAQSEGCEPLGPDLKSLAALFAARGVRVTGMIVPARTADSGEQCINGNLYPSWDDLAALRDRFGWTFVSNGQRRKNLMKMDLQEQWDETCGSLAAFTAHGHTRAWGMFGPGSNRITPALATSPVGECFSFVRKYSGTSVNTRAEVVDAPYYVQTNDTTGGPCNLPPCSGEVPKRKRGYMLPSVLASWLAEAARPDSWVVLSTYKLVEGDKLSGGRRWDCSDPDPYKHWTSEVESYCLVDFLAALDARPAEAQVVDPATVAEAFGRVPVAAAPG